MKHEELTHLIAENIVNGNIGLKEAIETRNEETEEIDPFDLPIQIAGRLIPGTNRREQVYLVEGGYIADGVFYPGKYSYQKRKKVLIKKMASAGGYVYE